MGPNAPRDQQRAPQPDIYWRRRVIALALGIAIIGLLAWAVNGVVSGSNATSSAAGVGHPKSATVPPASAPVMPSLTPSGFGASAQASAANSPGPSGSPTPSPSPTRKTVTTAHTGDGCVAGDIVITLSAASYSYGSGVRPNFDAAVVSTSAHRCAFDIGAKEGVRLVIKSGPARVWASSDCPASGGTRITHLARGVPTTLHISWDRKTSVPGCQSPASVARPGTYTATVYSGLIRSNTVVFVLRGVGVAVP
ncbi:MAG: hypothetical protein QOJ73_2977 [Streptosporangiaceae bacterium]|jgi:hypothetical protein|nr:hypothetical protein [Streptosporangiaceae bacterium]